MSYQYYRTPTPYYDSKKSWTGSFVLQRAIWNVCNCANEFVAEFANVIKGFRWEQHPTSFAPSFTGCALSDSSIATPSTDRPPPTCSYLPQSRIHPVGMRWNRTESKLLHFRNFQVVRSFIDTLCHALSCFYNEH